MTAKIETIWKKFRTANRMDDRTEDVASFLGIPEERAQKKLDMANGVVSQRWAAMKERLTGANLMDYYSSEWWLLKRLQRQKMGFFWRTLIRYIYELPKNQNILDYGCGAGEYSIFAADRKHTVTAFEVAGIQTEWLRWFAELLDHDIKVVASPNVWKMADVPEDEYDVVIAAAVFEHMLEPQKVAHHIMSRIKTGGKLYALLGYKAAARGHVIKSIKQLPEVEKILRSRDDVEVSIARDIDGKPL